MSDMLKLYHATNSPNSRRVRIFLAEKGLKPTLISVDLGTGEHHSEAYRTINPRRMVPALVLVLVEGGEMLDRIHRLPCGSNCFHSSSSLRFPSFIPVPGQRSGRFLGIIG